MYFNLKSTICYSVLLSIGYLAWANVVASEVVEYAPIVQLNAGKVRGLVQEADGRKVHFYQGIRYGTAKRFAIAKPVKPWTGVYNATTYRDACIQCVYEGRLPWLLNYTETESEDCLFLNVWSPQPVQSTNRAVMFYIHGGSYISGTIFSPVLDGRWIAAQGDVVMITIAYRLGPFGMLYGGSKQAPGNAALHDQILALKWVQANIHKFGGDPSKVTIFGESAGSFSTGALILSPLTTGLFARAIMQSGGPNTQSRLIAVSPQENLAKTEQFARKVNCPIWPKELMIACLRLKPAEVLRKATVGAVTISEYFSLMYGDELLPTAPVQAVERGKFNVDLMYGVTSHEGSTFIGGILAQATANGTQLTVQKLYELVPPMMAVYRNQAKNWTEVTEFYVNRLPAQPTQDELKTTLADIIGDYSLACPTFLFGEQLSLASPHNSHYAYRVMQNAKLINWFEGPLPSWMGVPHEGDLRFLFSIANFDECDEPTVQLSADMIRAWTNFAKTGHPGRMGQVEWTKAMPVRATSCQAPPTTQYMALDSANYTMVKGYYAQSCNQLWKPIIWV